MAGILRAEWTKLISVRRWVLGLAAAAVLTVLMGLVSSTASGSDANQHPDFVVGPDGQPVVDDFYFVHQRLAGDGSITAQVLGQQSTHEDAAAGLVVKESIRSGSPYAAALVTARHGVRLESNFAPEPAGGKDSGPARWLRLTRAGTSVTGYESADGVRWSELGTVQLPGLPQTVEVGLIVTSPPEMVIERSAGSTSVGGHATYNTARFGNVRVDGSLPAPGWVSEDVGQSSKHFGKRPPGTGSAEAGGVFTVTGTGEIGPSPRSDDRTQISLFGVTIGLIAVIAVAVLYVTTEYKQGMIRTTFAATPRRGSVLAAKAVVISGITFVVGLAATVTAYVITQPILRDNGFAPPAYPPESLFDLSVLRAIIGSAAFLAVLAVFGLGVGMALRHSAGAITTVIGLVMLPMFVAILLPVTAAKWLMLLTPTGGFAMQRAKPPTPELVEPWAMIGPWQGFGVTCAYAVVALGVAYWRLRRQDAA